MEVIVFSNPKKDDREISAVVKMFKEGLQTFHLRKPKYSKSGYEEFLNRIPSKYHNRIVLHGHYKLVRKYKLKGIHITRDFRKKRFKARLKLTLLKALNKNLVVSRSFHSVGGMNDVDFSYDYVFLSPIFDSISKKDHTSHYSKRLLKATLQDIDLNIVALGGVDASKLAECKDLGFDKVALLGALWSGPTDPFKTYCQIMDELLYHGAAKPPLEFELTPVKLSI